jgi:aspartate/methionine/tyrosine aminotransferase
MKSNFVTFQLERVMSVWEYQVEYNLSESGIHPMTTCELLMGDQQLIEEFLSTELNYPQTNGEIALREQISALYPGAGIDNIVVTTGAAQANFTTILTALDPGDEIVVMLPNYMQIWGLAQNYNLKLKTFSLREELDWRVDLEELEHAVSDNTKLIAICNPNNPTGHIMTDDEIDAVVNAAQNCGAWILSDEVYAGTEHYTDDFTPSLWGRYERVFAIGSLSKAYGLPGLRLGWVVAPADMAENIWARQDYITISATKLSNELAAYALSPVVRPRLLARSRQYVRDGYRIFDRWYHQHNEMFSLVPPQAAAIAFVRYHQNINSSRLVDRLIEEKQTFVVPGDHFGLDHYLRISYGLSAEYVNEGLDRLYQVLTSFG